MILQIFAASRRLQFVEIVVETRNVLLLGTLPLPRLEDDPAGLGERVQRIAGEDLPVVEYALREGLGDGVDERVRV